MSSEYLDNLIMTGAAIGIGLLAGWVPWKIGAIVVWRIKRAWRAWRGGKENKGEAAKTGWWQEWRAEQREKREKTARIPVWRSVVLLREFRGWPLVRHTARGHWSMLAVHKAPQRTQNWGGLQGPVITGIAVAVLVGYRFNVKGDEDYVFAGVSFGLFYGVVSIPFWWVANKTWLVIRFVPAKAGDAMVWTGPEKQWWRKRRHRVGLEEIHSLSVIAPHRWADEERRKHDNWRQSHPGQPGPKPLFQTASELILHTGPEGSHWRTVAEFVNDAHGEQANRLMRAIGLVTGFVRTEQAAVRKKVVVAGPL